MIQITTSPVRRAGRIWLAALFTLLAAAWLSPGQSSNKKQQELYLGGEPGAPVKIEVFSDYQCGYCRTFYLETLKPLLANYAGKQKVYVTYHDFPLQTHKFARPATRLALAAMNLGRERWLRVTDILYSAQAQWAQNGDFDAVLAKVLDPAELVRVKKLAADPAIDVAIEHEILAARSLNITSTPTYFITTEAGRQQRLSGILPYAVLRDYIDRVTRQ